MNSFCSTKYRGSDILSIHDFSRDDLDFFLTTAKQNAQNPKSTPLQGLILASCFFEPSTRTRLSFESAMIRLGGSCIGFADAATTSSQKGESLTDSIRIMSAYADVLVIRHPMIGSAKLAAQVSQVPVINAGDGANEHPTQTLVDLYTILECHQTIDGLQIAIGGDLKFGRTVHSLCYALAHYQVRLFFVSSPQLAPPESLLSWLREKGVVYSLHSRLEEVLPYADILYMTRIQKERFASESKPLERAARRNLSPSEEENELSVHPQQGTWPYPYRSEKSPFFEEEVLQNPCLLKLDHLDKVTQSFRILHPLPRVDEIDPAIDATAHAYYFQQAANGVLVRSTLLSLILTGK